jgi:hypothetical protein
MNDDVVAGSEKAQTYRCRAHNTTMQGTIGAHRFRRSAWNRSRRLPLIVSPLGRNELRELGAQ